MKRFRVFFTSLKAWWQLSPFRRGKSGVAFLYSLDEFDVTLANTLPPDMFEGIKPFTGGSVDRRITFSGRVSTETGTSALVYIVLPKELP